MLFERNGQNSMDCYGQLMGTEILRKDTIAGKCAFSLFQFTVCFLICARIIFRETDET